MSSASENLSIEDFRLSVAKWYNGMTFVIMREHPLFDASRVATLNGLRFELKHQHTPSHHLVNAAL